MPFHSLALTLGDKTIIATTESEDASKLLGSGSTSSDVVSAPRLTGVQMTKLFDFLDDESTFIKQSTGKVVKPAIKVYTAPKGTNVEELTVYGERGKVDGDAESSTGGVRIKGAFTSNDEIPSETDHYIPLLTSAQRKELYAFIDDYTATVGPMRSLAVEGGTGTGGGTWTPPEGGGGSTDPGGGGGGSTDPGGGEGTDPGEGGGGTTPGGGGGGTYPGGSDGNVSGELPGSSSGVTGGVGSQGTKKYEKQGGRYWWHYGEDVNLYWWQWSSAVMVGNEPAWFADLLLDSITVQCGSKGNGSPIYMGVWDVYNSEYDKRPIGVSINTQVARSGARMTFKFGGLPISWRRDLRFLPVLSRDEKWPERPYIQFNLLHMSKDGARISGDNSYVHDAPGNYPQELTICGQINYAKWVMEENSDKTPTDKWKEDQEVLDKYRT